MPKPRTGRGVNLLQNLPQLQNLIKRDPASYRSEFLNQYNHYVSLLRILQQSPLAFSNSNSEFDAAGASSSSGGNNTTAGQTFRELVTFVAQVAQCYPEETKTFPQELSALILEDGRGAKGLGNDTRKTIVQNLVMLRNKDVISSIEWVTLRSSSSISKY
jgi:protein SDA1